MAKRRGRKHSRRHHINNEGYSFLDNPVNFEVHGTGEYGNNPPPEGWQQVLMNGGMGLVGFVLADAVGAGVATRATNQYMPVLSESAIAAVGLIAGQYTQGKAADAFTYAGLGAGIRVLSELLIGKVLAPSLPMIYAPPAQITGL